MVNEHGLHSPGVGRSGKAVDEGCEGGVGGSKEGRVSAKSADKVSLLDEGCQGVESLAHKAVLEGASSTLSRSASASILIPATHEVPV